MGGRLRRDDIGQRLVDASLRLRTEVDHLRFADPVAYVYNPLAYAWAAHEAYLRRYGGNRGVTLLLGMNPGPWGMAQTGVPFGEVAIVREWLGIDRGVSKPEREHPKRPILGFDCHRSEVSGARLWGWARDRFGEPRAFFTKFFVWNYCPLSFMVESGANYTPDKLPASEREPLFEACDRGLREVVSILEPKMIVGVGKFAEQRAGKVAGDLAAVGTILHPSPASPVANRGWAAQAEAQLSALGLL